MRRRFERCDEVWPAGLGRRLGAMLYDGLLLLAIWIAIGALHVTVSRLLLDIPPERIGLGAAQVLSLRAMMALSAFVFFDFFWRRAGMTLGMQAWRLRVQTCDGHAISLGQSLLRFMVATLSFVPFGLGHLWLLFDGERRSWADMASATQVVVLPKR